MTLDSHMPPPVGDPGNPFPYGSRDLYAKIYGPDYVRELDRRASVELRRRAAWVQADAARRMGPYPMPLPRPLYPPRPVPSPQPTEPPPIAAHCRLPKKHHNIALHILLLMFTLGIGNLVYWAWIVEENHRLGYGPRGAALWASRHR